MHLPIHDATVTICQSTAIAAVRIFALWNRDWRLFALIMIPGLFPALTNLVCIRGFLSFRLSGYLLKPGDTSTSGARQRSSSSLRTSTRSRQCRRPCLLSPTKTVCTSNFVKRVWLLTLPSSIHRSPGGFHLGGRDGGPAHVAQDVPDLRPDQRRGIPHQLLHAHPSGWHAIFPVSSCAVRTRRL